MNPFPKQNKCSIIVLTVKHQCTLNLHMIPLYPYSSPSNSNRKNKPPVLGERRKKGGQPGNSNAFRHGLYSAHSHSFPNKSFKFPRVSTDPYLLQKDLRDHLLAAGKKEFWEDRYKLVDILAASKGGLPHSAMLSQLRATTIIVGRMQKIARSLFELDGRQSQLRSILRDLPALLRWEFHEMGIPARPAFVPRKLVNPHANLDWEAPHLTDAQWDLLQETCVSQRVDIDYFRKYRRRKPLPSDRYLLEGILWKLANGLRWRELAGKYPVRRCQELYTALCRSGRMQTIYNRLRGHLDVNGGSTLGDLVEHGCFVISGNRVLLAPAETLTWEKYTALLLLQRGYHAFRSIRRENDSERRRQGGYYRLPKDRDLGFYASKNSRSGRRGGGGSKGSPFMQQIDNGSSIKIKPTNPLTNNHVFGSTQPEFERGALDLGRDFAI